MTSTSLSEDGYTLPRATVAQLLAQAQEAGVDAISLGVSVPDTTTIELMRALGHPQCGALRTIEAHVSVDLDALQRPQAPPPSLARLLQACRTLIAPMRQMDAYAATGDLLAAERLVAEIDTVLARAP